MWILGQKNCQKWTKSPISRFAIFQKWASRKTLLLLHFSIFSPEIFRMRVKVHFALKTHFYFWSGTQKKFGGQIPENARANAGIWPPNFFWGLNQKSAPILSAKCTFTRILKISGENIEKCRRRSDLREAHFWNIANRDIGDFVHFWLFFWPNIHILAVIELEIDWEVYFKTTNHIKLLSWKNIDIWPSYRPKTMKFGGRAHIWA